MGIRDIFCRTKSSNALKGAIAVQRLKEFGCIEALSMSQIVTLITNLPDAKKHLNEAQFYFVKSVFDIYRKQTDLLPMMSPQYIQACKTIIDTYESEVPYFLFDGKYSESLSSNEIDDIWLLYNNGIRYDEMLDIVIQGTLSKQAAEMRHTESAKANGVNIFHIARRPDGTLEPIIAAKIQPNNTTLLQQLLRTSDLGVVEAVHNGEDFYYILFDQSASKPYSDVIIMKFENTEHGRHYVDMSQKDMDAVTYAADNYLLCKARCEAPVETRPEPNTTASPICYCHRCGNKLVEDSLFCNRCGTKIPYPADADNEGGFSSHGQ